MEDELLELERRFWDASSARDGDFYRAHAAGDALYVFPGLASAVTNEECAKAVDENVTPWAWFRIEEPRFLRLTDDVALLTYTCRCQYEGAEPLAIQATTIYRAVEDGWQLVFHQQAMAPSD